MRHPEVGEIPSGQIVVRGQRTGNVTCVIHLDALRTQTVRVRPSPQVPYWERQTINAVHATVTVSAPLVLRGRSPSSRHIAKIESDVDMRGPT